MFQKINLFKSRANCNCSLYCALAVKFLFTNYESWKFVKCIQKAWIVIRGYVTWGFICVILQLNACIFIINV